MKSKTIRTEFIHYVTMNMLGLLGISCYILADTYFIAKGEGIQGLTSLNIALPVFNLIHATGLMIGIGSSTRYSLSQTKGSFTQGLQMILLFSLVFLSMGLFGATEVAKLLGANASILKDTAIYLQVLLFFSPMFLLNNLLLGFVRNDGKPKLVMLAMTAGSISNIILDYIFIFPLKMGMFGAALATGISPFMSIIIMTNHFIRKENTFHIIKEPIKIKTYTDISALGLSSFITEISNGVVIFFFNFIILGLNGNLGVAAFGIITNISLVVMALFSGLVQGMQPILSKAYGRGEKHHVKSIYQYGTFTSLGIALIVYWMVFLCSDGLIHVFNKDNNVGLMQIAKPGIRLYFLSLLFAGINILNAGYFSAIGFSKWGFLIAILRGLVVIIPVLLLLSFFFQMTGVWLTLTVTELCVLFLTRTFFRKTM